MAARLKKIPLRNCTPSRAKKYENPSGVGHLSGGPPRAAQRAAFWLADHPIRSVRIGDRLETRESSWELELRAGSQAGAFRLGFCSAPIRLLLSAGQEGVQFGGLARRQSWSPSAGSQFHLTLNSDRHLLFVLHLLTTRSSPGSSSPLAFSSQWLLPSLEAPSARPSTFRT